MVSQFLGINNLTQFVVDEQSLVSLDSEDLSGKKILWLSAFPVSKVLLANNQVTQANISYKDHKLRNFDVVVVESVEQINQVLDSTNPDRQKILNPLGMIAVSKNLKKDADNLLFKSLQKSDFKITSSRCGSFKKAIDVMAKNPTLNEISDKFITHKYSAKELPKAFEVAKSKECVKAIIFHD